MDCGLPKTTAISCVSPIANLAKPPVSPTFKIYPASNHFEHPLPPALAQPPASRAWPPAAAPQPSPASPSNAPQSTLISVAAEGVLLKPKADPTHPRLPPHGEHKSSNGVQSPNPPILFPLGPRLVTLLLPHRPPLCS